MLFVRPEDAVLPMHLDKNLRDNSWSIQLVPIEAEGHNLDDGAVTRQSECL